MREYQTYYDRRANGIANTRSKYEAVYKNREDFLIDLNQCKDLFINRFIWQTPDFNTSPYYFERCILLYGAVGIFWHEEFGIMALPCIPQKKNIYGEVATWRVFRFNPNGYSDVGGTDDFFAEVAAENIAIICDNPEYFPPIRMIRRYAERTSDLRRTEEVYTKGLKSPNLVFVGSEQAETAGLIQQQIDDNKAVITLDKSLLKDNSTIPVSLQTGKTASEAAVLMKLAKYKLSELLARLGLNANEALKGANLTEDEVYQNGEMARRVFACAKQCRENGINEARRKFGLNISFKELYVHNPLVADESLMPQSDKPLPRPEAKEE